MNSGRKKSMVKMMRAERVIQKSKGKSKLLYAVGT